MANSNYETYIRDARRLAQIRGFQWELDCDDSGIAKEGWNLTAMSGASPPPTYWVRDVGSDLPTLNVLNSKRSQFPLRKQLLTKEWQDLIKASIIDQICVRQNTPSHILFGIVRPLRVMATCVPDRLPWEVNASDVGFAYAVASEIQGSRKIADLLFGVVKTILDANHLTDAGPLSGTLTRTHEFKGKRARFAKAESDIRYDLQERRRAERLPERRAFWELARIVFTEKASSFLDLLRFAQIRVLLLTGFRVGEAALIPADWKRVRDYFDARGRPAEEQGGYSRSLLLRYFAEKQRGVNEDSIALYENTQHIPQIFEEMMVETLDTVAKATEPLRRTLRQQHETGRILPQFEEDDLVLARELYPYLTGNPFTYNTKTEIIKRYVSEYQSNYDPSIFDRIRSAQAAQQSVRVKLNLAANAFLLRLDRSLLRTGAGDKCERGYTDWSDTYIRIRDIEIYYRMHVTSKLSDLMPLKLAVGELPVHKLLFLMPKRALAEGRNEGLCDITRYFSIGRMDPSMMSHCLCSATNDNIFAKYGQTEEDRRLTVNPHSLRHLQNAELFRLEIADTVITKRFNRRTLAQSHEYDHRSLAEELKQVEIPEDVEIRLGDKASTVARMIKAGKAQGPIVTAFRRIQESEGDDAAFEYLKAEADGFHSTPYGHCLNSFTVDPCPKHLECFSGCRNLSATNLPQHRQNLVVLEARLEAAIQTIEARDSASIGRENQLQHARVRLQGVRKLLSTPEGERVFPEGPDLSVLSQGEETAMDTEM